jgi:hypothetical protein
VQTGIDGQTVKVALFDPKQASIDLNQRACWAFDFHTQCPLNNPPLLALLSKAFSWQGIR